MGEEGFTPLAAEFMEQLLMWIRCKEEDVQI
jgi:hypothetical protein